MNVAVIIVNNDRPDLTHNLVENLKNQSILPKIYVVEMGNNKLKKNGKFERIDMSNDGDFKGKCFGHNVGLNYVFKSKNKYDYYCFLMNDLVIDDNNALKKMITIMEKNKNIGIISPTEEQGNYAAAASKPQKGKNFHLVSTTDYLFLLIPERVIKEFGFLNPDFKFSWGAIHEYAYKLYSNNYKVAYCDIVQMKHLGGTTYGKVKNVISRGEYIIKASQFASRYFVENYGKNWDKDFSNSLPKNDVIVDMFSQHRRFWEKKLAQNERRIYSDKSLNPWYYPVIIDGKQVIAGIGSNQSNEELISRTNYRQKLLVDELSKYYDFNNTTLLDLASNCAYWSARYLEKGAKSLVAVEGRFDYIKQGELYYSSNKFTDNYKFIHSNVDSPDLWNKLNKMKFDFILCCGILYHIKNYESMLKQMCNITNDAILIDTRVSKDDSVVEEPGGWCFDAIAQTKEKRVPILSKINKILKDLNFDIINLKINEKPNKGCKGPDNYNNGNRVCILARRK